MARRPLRPQAARLQQLLPGVRRRIQHHPAPAVGAIARVDAYLGADAAPVDLVKIDAEGAEPAVVAGMSRLLARSPHLKIVAEFIPGSLRRAGHDPRAFLASLTGLGFRLQRIDGRGRFRETTIERLVDSPTEELFVSR